MLEVAAGEVLLQDFVHLRGCPLAVGAHQHIGCTSAAAQSLHFPLIDGAENDGKEGLLTQTEDIQVGATVAATI